MKRLLCICALLFLLTGCAAEPVTRQFFAMDTVMSVSAYGRAAEAGLDAAIAEVNRLEALLSRTRTDSEISLLNTSAPAFVSLSEDTLSLLRLSQLWWEKTDGAFDITVGPVAASWGFAGGDGTYRVPSEAELAGLLALVGTPLLTIDADCAALAYPGMAVDLGGIAKGYAGAQLSKILQQHNISSALLSLGGNITAIGSKPDGSPWRIGVQDPADPSALAGTLALQDCSAVTSGAYQRCFEADGVLYHHIIDPRTGYPSRSGLASVTVVSSDPTLADLLSTACFVLGEEQALALWRTQEGFDLILITLDGRLLLTSGLESCFSADVRSGYVPQVVQRAS